MAHVPTPRDSFLPPLHSGQGSLSALELSRAGKRAARERGGKGLEDTRSAPRDAIATRALWFLCIAFAATGVAMSELPALKQFVHDLMQL